MWGHGRDMDVGGLHEGDKSSALAVEMLTIDATGFWLA